MHRSTRGHDYQRVARPVAALVDEYPAGFVDAPHAHERAQLLYASAGVMTVTTDDASFTIPPQRGVWVPAGARHEALCRTPVSLRTLYVESGVDARLPGRCQVLRISPLLRELILEACSLPMDYDPDARDGRVMSLILDEVAEAVDHQASALRVPMPSDPRLLRVCHAFMQDPARKDGLDRWASVAGMGRRTFTRAFLHETGPTFSDWRQQVRLAEALSLLSLGRSVTSVAFSVGYDSSSAFAAMFRCAFGVAPSRYFDQLA